MLKEFRGKQVIYLLKDFVPMKSILQHFILILNILNHKHDYRNEIEFCCILFIYCKPSLIYVFYILLLIKPKYMYVIGIIISKLEIIPLISPSDISVTTDWLRYRKILISVASHYDFYTDTNNDVKPLRSRHTLSQLIPSDSLRY